MRAETISNQVAVSCPECDVAIPIDITVEIVGGRFSGDFAVVATPHVDLVWHHWEDVHGPWEDN